MKKEEILEKSRKENKNRDLYELEVANLACKYAAMVMVVLAGIFFLVERFVSGNMNYALWALLFSGNMAMYWVKYIKLRSKTWLWIAILYTIMVFLMSGEYIYNLIASSTIL